VLLLGLAAYLTDSGSGQFSGRLKTENNVGLGLLTEVATTRQRSCQNFYKVYKTEWNDYVAERAEGGHLSACLFQHVGLSRYYSPYTLRYLKRSISRRRRPRDVEEAHRERGSRTRVQSTGRCLDRNGQIAGLAGPTGHQPQTN